jgi:hypothetical protein
MNYNTNYKEQIFKSPPYDLRFQNFDNNSIPFLGTICGRAGGLLIFRKISLPLYKSPPRC